LCVAPRPALDGAEIVLICVLKDEQVLDVALGPDGALETMRPGGLVIVHTTGSPTTVARLAAAGRDREIEVLDAPVSGTPSAVRQGAITLLVGGSASAVARGRPVLSAYGEPVLHLGPLGTGQKVKLVNNLLLAAQVQLGVEALRIGEAIGLDRTELAGAVAHCSGASRALGMVAAGDPHRAILADLAKFLGKDVTVAAQVAADIGVDLGYLGEVAQWGPARFGDHPG
jgi:3-hydroxyisobutyrate dehydrogenase-like beta-hydroxyacid dehydrogenase